MKMKKKITLSIVLCLLMILTTLSPLTITHATEKSNLYSNAAELIKAGKAPTSLEANKIFAGWYKEDNYATPITSAESVPEDGAYAKFVDKNVLSVKFQISSNTVKTSGSTNLRMVTTVDTRSYQSVGFLFSIGGKETLLPYDSVHDTITGYVNRRGVSYAPSYFSSESNYFMAYTLNNIKSNYFQLGLTVTPTWTTLDGTIVKGDSRTFTVEEIIEACTITEATIYSAEEIGTWVQSGTVANSYDNNASTKWNPQATDYKSGEGIVYTLQNVVNLTELQLTFGSRNYYFTVEVSENGREYTTIATVDENSKGTYYTEDYLCILDNLTAENVRYIKVELTGDSQNNKFVNLFEIDVYGSVVADTREAVKATITNGTPSGAWSSLGASQFSPEKSYDGDSNTSGSSKWNPQASSGYASKEAIVYTLDKVYDLTQLKLTFGSRYYYFDVSVSSDMENYVKVASVNASNYTTYYSSGYVCELNLIAEDAKYLKISFTGDSQNNTYVNLFEVECYGKVEENVNPIVEASIYSATPVGTWTYDRVGSTTIAPEFSYDNAANTKWNPEASTGYANNEGIVYTLKDVHDLTELQLTFASRYYYFTVGVSANGRDYTTIAAVDANNKDLYYTTDYVCILDNLTAENVRYIKINFTGASDNSTFVNLHEIDVYGHLVTDTREAVKTTITNGTPSGAWSSLGASQYSPEKSYDGDSNTSGNSKWNPQASSGYASNEAIVYTLDKVYDLTQLKLTFGSRYYYFDVSVSSDMENYVKVASVNANNYTTYYLNDYVCTLNLIAEDAKYLKISFTGDSQNSTYVNLFEVECYGKVEENVNPIVEAAIYNAEEIGTWAQSSTVTNSYDNSTSTKWNPQATDYKSGEGIVYTLQNVVDLTELQLTFGSRHYYFTVEVSENGRDYTTIATVDENSKGTYYIEDYSCVLDNLTAGNVRYIKVEFTGDSQNNKFVNLFEIDVYGSVVEDTREAVKATITVGTPSGGWLQDKVGTETNPPEKSYDGNSDTSGSSKWNPQASSGYASNEAIVYTLDKVYDLTQLKLTFASRYYYFDVFVSSDMENYVKVASVNASNYTTYYLSDYVCTLNVIAEDAKYLKISFTGDSQNNTYVNLYEVEVLGKVEQ